MSNASDVAATSAPTPPTKRVARTKRRRRLGAIIRLTAALFVLGGMYTAFAPASGAEDTTLSAAAAKGKQLYELNCSSCHGPNAQGVPGRGPSLIGSGSAAVEFQVTSGRMPMARQEAQAQRKPPSMSTNDARDIGQYVEELGGGPQLPDPSEDLADGDVVNGGKLFRINCSSCHSFSAAGGALSSGKFAPPLDPASDRQIYAAMLTGPQNMPVFGDNQLTPKEKRDIIAYIKYMKEDQDPGGAGIGRLGPVPEGLVIFTVGMVALIFATLWIAGKS